MQFSPPLFDNGCFIMFFTQRHKLARLKDTTDLLSNKKLLSAQIVTRHGIQRQTSDVVGNYFCSSSCDRLARGNKINP